MYVYIYQILIKDNYFIIANIKVMLSKQKSTMFNNQIFINMLKIQSFQLQTQSFQTQIMPFISNQKPTPIIFELFNYLVNYYGFSVALAFHDFYKKISREDLQRFRENRIQIDQSIIQQIGCHYQFHFHELSCNLALNKAERKLLKKHIVSYGMRSQQRGRFIIEKHAHFNKQIINLAEIQKRLINYKGQRDFKQIYNYVALIYQNINKNLNYFQNQFKKMIIKKIARNIINLKTKGPELSLPELQQMSKIAQYVQNLIERKPTTIDPMRLINTRSNSSYQQKASKIEERVHNIPFYHNSPQKKIFAQHQKALPKFEERNVKQQQNAEKKNKNKIIWSESSQTKVFISHNSLKVGSIVTNDSPKAQPVKPKDMCCRTFFYQYQAIQLAQSLTRQYKHYAVPLTSKNEQILKKTITAFLNTAGGIIYLGIKEQMDRVRTVIGINLNERQKQDILFAFRRITETIEPQCCLNQLSTIKFVPIKNKFKLDYVSGLYVIKIIVKRGNPRQLYHYTSQDGTLISFRTQNEVIVRDPKKDFKKIYTIIKQRSTSDVVPDIKPSHEGRCPEPQLGKPKYI